jgi:hypothetical protein
MSDPIADMVREWKYCTDKGISSKDIAKQIRNICADKACEAVDLACHGWISRPTPASIKRHVRKALEVSNEKDS